MDNDLLSAIEDLLPSDTVRRDERVQAAVLAYETARADGLCHAGAWECAVRAVGTPDVTGRVNPPAGGPCEAE